MSLSYSKMVPLGSSAPGFDLPGVDGRNHSIQSYLDARFLVLVFMCNHCPYVQAVVDRLVQLEKEFRGRGVAFVGINANDASRYLEDSFEKMKEYAEKWGMEFDYLYDESQEVAQSYGALPTPDVFVCDGERKLVYRGRIDDGGQEETVSEDSLSIALEDLLSGREVSIEQKPSMGCNIKWR